MNSVFLSHSQRKSNEKLTKNQQNAEKVPKLGVSRPCVWMAAFERAEVSEHTLHLHTWSAGGVRVPPPPLERTRESGRPCHHALTAHACFHRARPGIPSFCYLGHQHKKEKERKGKKEHTPTQQILFYTLNTKTYTHGRKCARVMCVHSLRVLHLKPMSPWSLQSVQNRTKHVRV